MRLTGDASDKYSDMGQSSSNFSLGARLKVETPPESNRVSLKTLFDLRKQNDGSKFRPTRVLIWGAAGMGKTTLCKKMVYDFYHNGLWSDLYDRVVWLPLRRLKLMEHEAHDIIGLIQKEFFLNGPEKNLIERLQKVVIHDKRTLFILDGLDEVSYTLNPDTSIGRAFNSLLARTHVIITSRPHSTNTLDHIPPDLELETIGFFSQQVKEYIHCIAKQSNMSERTLLEIQYFIESHPLVQSLARIPIQLDAICYVWNTKHFPKDNVTMTTLYQAISQRLWAKDIVQLGKKFDGQPIDKRQIEHCPNVEGFVEVETKFLQELGFQGLCKEVIEFEITDVERVQKDLLMLGDSPVHMSFLRSSDNSSEAFDRTLHFIHLTFQEFFAAQYFVRHWTSSTALSLWRGPRGGLSARTNKLIKPEEFLKTEKYVGRYDIFWRFVAGLLYMEADHSHLYRFFKVLEEEPFDLIGLTHQRLIIHCLSEISPVDSECQHRVREREEHYIQWILCESRLKASVSSTSLMREAECSDYILETLLKKHETRSEVMKMLCYHPSISSNILDMILHILKRSTDTALRSAAIQVLGQQCNQSQGEKFLIFWHSVQDLSQTGRSEVVQALGQSQKLQQPAIEALIALLQDPGESVRSRAASALGRQTSLPSSAVEALIALLQDPEKRVRSATAQMLASREEFYYLIPRLDSLALKGLLEAWLSMGSVTCLIWNRSFWIDINGKQRRVPLQHEQQAPLKKAWVEAQEALNLPTLALEK
jgi:NACHT domain/HEAT repeats